MAKKDGEGAGAGAGAGAVTVEDLPRSIVRRVVKDRLSNLPSLSSSARNKGRGGGEEEDVSINKDALLAFSESARIFIHYLSATANDICKESKRQTINAEDVLKALEEIEFPEFIVPLKASLEDFRQMNAAKKSGAKGKQTDKKRKLETELPAQDGDSGGQDAMEEGENEDDEGGD